MPLGVRPLRWPLRPTRCSKRDTCRGEWYCTTFCTVPTSIPSSRELVHTTAFSRSAFLNSRSVCRRASFESEPWCTPTLSFTSAVWKSVEASDSARDRVFTNTSVPEEEFITSTTRWMRAHDSESSFHNASSRHFDGYSTRSCNPRASSAFTTIASRERNEATFFSFPTVALKPTTCSLPARCLNRSSKSDSWLPRLESTSSCTSSTTTVRTFANAYRIFGPMSSAARDSGVVTMQIGGESRCRARSVCVVSPCLTARLTPVSLHQYCIRSSISLFNALSGVM